MDWKNQCEVELLISNITYTHRSINSPVNNRFQANNHQLPLEVVKFKKVGYGRCDGCLPELGGYQIFTINTGMGNEGGRNKN